MTERSGLVVYDFCSGTGQASQAFLDRGHTVYRFDIDRQFRRVPNTQIIDLFAVDFSKLPRADVILFGTPCQLYTTLLIGIHWNPDHTPKTKEAAEAWNFTNRGIRLVQSLQPRFWWMENPRAKLRRLMEIHHPEIPRATVTYCSYGDTAMKPTDFWGFWPEEWVPRTMCKPNQLCHAPAPRGSAGHGSTTGKDDAAERGAWPYKVGFEMCLAVEKALAIEATPRIRDEASLGARASPVQRSLVDVEAGHSLGPDSGVCAGAGKALDLGVVKLAGVQHEVLAASTVASAEANEDLHLGHHVDLAGRGVAERAVDSLALVAGPVAEAGVSEGSHLATAGGAYQRHSTAYTRGRI